MYTLRLQSNYDQQKENNCGFEGVDRTTYETEGSRGSPYKLGDRLADPRGAQINFHPSATIF